jgi:membrane-bound ClpP family serine protease
MVFCPYCGSRLAVNIEALKLKMEDLRHDEITCGILGILGIVLLVVGVWLASITEVRYEWIGDTFYRITYHPYIEAATCAAVIGFIIAIIGFGFSAWYSYKRSKLMKQIESL